MGSANSTLDISKPLVWEFTPNYVNLDYKDININKKNKKNFGKIYLKNLKMKYYH